MRYLLLSTTKTRNCNLRVITLTWYVYDGTVVEVLAEELSIDRGAHQDDLQVRAPWQQVTQDHQQEVATKSNNRAGVTG